MYSQCVQSMYFSVHKCCAFFCCVDENSFGHTNCTLAFTHRNTQKNVKQLLKRYLTNLLTEQINAVKFTTLKLSKSYL